MERERAALSAARAARHEAKAVTAADGQRQLHVRMGQLHRRSESRHMMSARIHEELAARMDGWHDPVHAGSAPPLMRAVAGMLGTSSALATLAGQTRTAGLVAASDSRALRAHDLEQVFAEGPATEAAKGVPVTVGGDGLLERWPGYGPAVAQMGVGVVSAAPLGRGYAGVGALCAFDHRPASAERIAAMTRLMAEVLTGMLLNGAGAMEAGAEPGILTFLAEDDRQTVVHQAVGIVSEQCGCGADDAADLLAARAFADGKPVAEIAQQVVRGKTRL
jgi:ANTAR domain-containing protein